jgi:hypothetical protein
LLLFPLESSMKSDRSSAPSPVDKDSVDSEDDWHWQEAKEERRQNDLLSSPTMNPLGVLKHQVVLRKHRRPSRRRGAG